MKEYRVIYCGQNGRLDISGERFGRLVVKEYSHTSSERKAVWLCICDCGKECLIEGKAMRGGHTQSCGCLQVDRAKEANTTHGESKKRLHRIWSSMKGRTTNPNHFRYEYYGARGIKVCEEWRVFENFRDWASGNGYKDDLTIERIDVNGNYEPSNCTWITMGEQQNNKRTSLKNRI